MSNWLCFSSNFANTLGVKGEKTDQKLIISSCMDESLTLSEGSKCWFCCFQVNQDQHPAPWIHLSMTNKGSQQQFECKLLIYCWNHSFGLNSGGCRRQFLKLSKAVNLTSILPLVWRFVALNSSLKLCPHLLSYFCHFLYAQQHEYLRGEPVQKCAALSPFVRFVLPLLLTAGFSQITPSNFKHLPV